MFKKKLSKRGGLKKPTKAKLTIKSSELTIDDPKYAGAPVSRKELETRKRVSFDPFATVLGVDEQGNDIEFADEDNDDEEDEDDDEQRQQQRQKPEHVVVSYVSYSFLFSSIDRLLGCACRI